MPKKRLSVIATKTGDKGMTSLVGGKRVSKGSHRVEAYGTVDELNAYLGWIRSELKDKEIREILRQIQEDLFILGADLAAPLEVKAPRIGKGHIERIENLISLYLKEVPPLEEFVVPGGSKGSALLHLARVITRRAERKVAMMGKKSINPLDIVFLNRLSDLFFVFSRVLQRRSGMPEELISFPKEEGKKQDA